MYGESMFNTTQTDRLADALIGQVDPERWLLAFEWGSEPLEPAWPRRLALVAEGRADGALHYADRVHKWGFSHAVQARVRQHPEYDGSLHALCETWSANARHAPCKAAVDSLAALLEIPHLGIARVSKFICFLDQEQYGIYDSRVSYALKDLSLDGTTRVFPLIGGRQVHHSWYVLSDPVAADAQCMAAVYVAVVQLLLRTAQKLNRRGGIAGPGAVQVCGEQWTSALLEMALFMAGQRRERRRTSAASTRGCGRVMPHAGLCHLPQEAADRYRHRTTVPQAVHGFTGAPVHPESGWYHVLTDGPVSCDTGDGGRMLLRTALPACGANASIQSRRRSGSFPQKYGHVRTQTFFS
jgi:hypothetical protein